MASLAELALRTSCGYCGAPVGKACQDMRYARRWAKAVPHEERLADARHLVVVPVSGEYVISYDRTDSQDAGGVCTRGVG